MLTFNTRLSSWQIHRLLLVYKPFDSKEIVDGESMKLFNSLTLKDGEMLLIPHEAIVSDQTLVIAEPRNIRDPPGYPPLCMYSLIMASFSKP